MTEHDDTGAVLHKHPKRREFTQAQNATIRDPHLSLKATGLLLYLLSLPQGAPVGSREIAKSKPDGRHAIMSAFRELKDLGYVEQSSIRGTDGKFLTVTHVFEVAPGAETAPGPGSGNRSAPGRENRAISLREKDPLKRKGDRLVCCGISFPDVDAYSDHLEVCPFEDVS